MCGIEPGKHVPVMLDPWQIKDIEQGFTHFPPVAEFRAAIGRPIDDVEASDEAVAFDCAARHLCRDVDRMDVTTDKIVQCIHCNIVAHKNCSENLLMQTPVALEFVVRYSDFCRSGKTRYRNVRQSLQHTIFFCILCKEKFTATKMEAMSKRKPPPDITVQAPRKKKKELIVSATVLRELRRCAAFYSLSYLFTKVEAKKKDEKHSMMEDVFYGSKSQRIKGAVHQLVDGDNAFAALYDVTEGESGPERVLKVSCCGKHTTSRYIAGVHYTAKDLCTFGDGKQFTGRSLWELGLSVLKSLKKAISLVPKLETRIVTIDKSLAVTGYASGKNEDIFLGYIDDGMYAMKLNEGPGRLLNVSESNDDDVDDDEGTDEVINEVDQEAIHTPDWDPFDGIHAPSGFVYIGKVAFISFGPSSKYFDPILRMGFLGETTAVNVGGGRTEIRKLNENRKNNDRAYGVERGMNIETKIQCGMMAQNEDDAAHRRRELNIVRLSKLIESTEKQIDLKLKMAEQFGEEYHAQCMMSVNLLMEKLERLTDELEKSGSDGTTQNPIVGTVLMQAARAMGLPKNDEDTTDNNDDEFAQGILQGTD